MPHCFHTLYKAPKGSTVVSHLAVSRVSHDLQYKLHNSILIRLTPVSFSVSLFYLIVIYFCHSLPLCLRVIALNCDNAQLIAFQSISIKVQTHTHWKHQSVHVSVNETVFFFLSSLPQQQPGAQVLSGHQSRERGRVSVGHQQQEGVQGKILECSEGCGEEPGAGGRHWWPVPTVWRRSLWRRRKGCGGHVDQPQRYWSDTNEIPH